MSSTEASDTEVKDLDVLDGEHLVTFHQALRRILATPHAEFAYAQILDGLPTEASLGDSFLYMESHPVYKLGHKDLCEGFIEKARDFRGGFNPSDLCFKQSLLVAFQNTTPNSKPFYLRLIELVVVACHQIAAHLFELDSGAHKHQLHQDWLDIENQATGDGLDLRPYDPPVAAFFHKAYQSAEQYPRGLADVVGYWAEGKIFGGVVVFDRGETEQECNSMWIYGSDIFDPKTIYPPTEEQFDALVDFLLGGPNNTACPLPIQGTRLNRPRWDPDHAIARFHIFRDKWERKIPAAPLQHECVRNSKDWPELDDRNLVQIQLTNRQWGAPVDEEALAAAEERLKLVTPSSPCWNPYVIGAEQNEAG
ncbi:hypothetical protein EDB81DRAFT_766293 [Dactylonectria macrodidyma]|uniref:Uncharacterized protein n=1 Tax=Dactylonectria macrodidyma TaxID=307937 RepID=A0A9P9DLT1_9HYPO|nr:hypothetical protein EDB81DRAFT_766293 [Dactylonectria macrodidyma]